MARSCLFQGVFHTERFLFTGLVTAIGTLAEVVPIGGGRDARLRVLAPWADPGSILPGASICCSGCCLTAVTVDAEGFSAEVSAETLARTTLGAWRTGTRINLERSLRLGDELGGHFVFGHVDAVTEVIDIAPENGSLRMAFALPPALARLLAEKGSVAVDGVSLTVNAVDEDAAGARFAVNVIAHTASATTLGALRVGDRVNLEADMLARYVARHIPGTATR